MNKTDCDIVMPVFNQAVLTKNCIDSVTANTDSPYKLLLIDNGSEPATAHLLKDISLSRRDFKLIRNDNNLGWVKAVNQGMRLSTAPYVCVMNNDTIVRTPGWLSKMIALAESSPVIGLVNPEFNIKKTVASDRPFMELDFCRGYCMLIKRAVIERAGLFDENYGIGYYDDDDYSVRAIKAGFICVRVNGVLVEHAGDSTFRDIFAEKSRLELHERNKKLFYSKWGKRLNLLFVLGGKYDEKDLSDILFELARRQHIIYVWFSGPQAEFPHINIRSRFFPVGLVKPFLSIALCLNRTRKKSKHYNAVFSDSPGAFFKRAGIYVLDIRSDKNKILSTVDSLSKVVL